MKNGNGHPLTIEVPSPAAARLIKRALSVMRPPGFVKSRSAIEALSWVRRLIRSINMMTTADEISYTFGIADPAVAELKAHL